MQKLRSVQVLRGVAALGVAVHHAFPGDATKGAAGVDLFFVISGFIMATVARNRRPGEFLFDRFWRIFPMWFVAVLPWLLFNPVGVGRIATSLTLWPVWGGYYYPALDIGWTLCFEMLFYVGFAVALAARSVVPVLAAYALFFTLGLMTNTPLFDHLGSPMALEFLMGVCIALLPTRAGIVSLLIGLAAFALAPATMQGEAFGLGGLQRLVVWGIPAALILYGIRALEPWFAHRAFALPVLIGGASYSIYLFHKLVLLVAGGAAGVILTAVFGIGVYWFVERRIIAAKPQLRGKALAGTLKPASDA